MSHFQPSTFLRRALILDAVASGATAILLIGGAGLLTDLLGLPVSLMRWAGLVLLPYVAFVAYLGMRAQVTAAAINGVIAINIIWALASLGLLLSGWIAPTVLGYAFVIAQAAVVAAFGVLQHVGLRQADRAFA